MGHNYFVLSSTVPAAGGIGTLQRRQIVLYLGVLAGALSNVIYNLLGSGPNFSYVPFVLALIASVVTFPGIYKQAGLNRGRITWAKWATAFQNGFFWSIAMGQLL